MTTADDFLHAIAEAPDDDTPRLVFADWLEEQGDPRGEFIRRQCELEQLDEDDPARPEHESRCQLLLSIHERKWLGGLPPLVHRWRFRRGLVDWVQVSAKNFLAHGDELFSLAPIRQVTINDINSYLADVADSPYLEKVEGLDIKPEFSWRQHDYPASLLTDEGLRRLLSSPFLGQLVSLDLGYNRISDGGLSFLARQETFPRLQRLDMSHNEIGGRGVDELGHSTAWAGELTDLALNNNDFSPFPSYALGFGAMFGRLRNLRLESTNMGSDDVYQLVIDDMQPRKPFAPLDRLFLDGNRLSPGAIDALSNSDLAAGLIELSLNSTSMDGDDGGPTVGRSAVYRNLRRLSMRHNNLGPATGESLAKSPALKALRLLDLRDNRIGDFGVTALAQSPVLANVTTLLLAENSIRDPGALALVESPYLERVVEIRLGNNPIGSAARHALYSRFGHRVIFDS